MLVLVQDNDRMIHGNIASAFLILRLERSPNGIIKRDYKSIFSHEGRALEKENARARALINGANIFFVFIRFQLPLVSNKKE